VANETAQTGGRRDVEKGVVKKEEDQPGGGPDYLSREISPDEGGPMTPTTPLHKKRRLKGGIGGKIRRVSKTLGDKGYRRKEDGA